MASSTMAELLKQAEEAGISSFVPPDGPATLEVVGANGSKTKKGDPKFGVQFKITEGPDAGKSFWTNFNLIAVKNDGSANSMGLAITFKDLASLGADSSTVAGWDVDAPTISEQVSAALVGNRVTADISVKESGGYTNINLRKIKPVGGAPAPAAQPQPELPLAAAAPQQGPVTPTF